MSVPGSTNMVPRVLASSSPPEICYRTCQHVTETSWKNGLEGGTGNARRQSEDMNPREYLALNGLSHTEESWGWESIQPEGHWTRWQRMLKNGAHEQHACDFLRPSLPSVFLECWLNWGDWDKFAALTSIGNSYFVSLLHIWIHSWIS